MRSLTPWLSCRRRLARSSRLVSKAASGLQPPSGLQLPSDRRLRARIFQRFERSTHRFANLFRISGWCVNAAAGVVPARTSKALAAAYVAYLTS